MTNSTTAWLYGACSVNTTLFGIGERVGNTPLEAMIMEYAQIKGNVKSMDLKVINEIEEYFEKISIIKYSQNPLCRSEFNVTKAGFMQMVF